MCLYPKLIKNKKYTANKKNGGVIPTVTDVRALYVPIACGNCIECRQRKCRDWIIRLSEEIKHNKNGKFITLTFSNESIEELMKHKDTNNLTSYDLDNQIATTAVRLFRERWRKRTGKSIRHWLVTELGHNGTENIHMHGILWTNDNYDTIRNSWKYGYIWPKPNSDIITYVNEETINYTTKYISKVDEKHKTYKSIVLASDGIGRNYTENPNIRNNKFNNEETIETYRTNTGHEMSLPIYYRNKIYTDEEKEKLWIYKLDRNERYICGNKIKADNLKEYYRLLEYHRKRSKDLGYGDDTKNWELIEYEQRQRELLLLKRLENEHGYPRSWDE